MKKFLKVMCLVLSLCLLLTSCGGGKKNGKYTELVMYVVGNKPADYDEVLEILNEKLKEDIGATVKVHFLGWGEYKNKYPLVLQGGESVDIVAAADYIPHRDFALKGAYLDITDLYEKWAPEAAEALDPKLLEVATINGKVYWLPCNNAGSNPHGYVVRGDLMDKYGIKEINSGDDFINYLLKVKENEKGLMPYNASQTDVKIYDSKYNPILGDVIYNDVTESEKDQLKNWYTYEDKEMEEYLNHQSEMLQKGYNAGCWPKDVLMNQTPSKDAFLAGTSASTIVNYLNFNDLYMKVMQTNPEWEPRFYYRGTDDGIPPVVSGGTGLAVARSSKNPEKALQFINLLNTDKEYNRLTTFGIEGKHYIETSPGLYKFPEGVDMNNTGFVPDDAGNWGWRNNDYFMFSEDSFEGFAENKNKFAEIGAWNIYAGFSKDDTKFVNEYAAVTSIVKENINLINWGMVDRKTVRTKEIKRLKDAGIDMIIDEITKQLKEYVKAKK